MMNIVIFILLIALIVYLVREYNRYAKRNSLIDRFEFGFDTTERDDESTNAPGDLLKINQLQEALDNSPLLHQFNLMLKRAGLKVSLLSAILIFIFASVIPAIFAYFYWGSGRSLVASLLVLPIVLWSVLSFLSTTAQKKLDAQLPALISNFLTTLNAGGTPMQALQSAAKNAPEPIGSSMEYINQQILLGATPVVAWEEWSNFWGTKSTKLVSTGIKIKWETGGQMSAILNHILETLEFNKRMELRVETLTAQAKLASYVLSALPVGLFFLTKSYRPDLFDVMFTDPLGNNLLWAAVILTVGGFLWLRKLSKLKY